MRGHLVRVAQLHVLDLYELNELDPVSRKEKVAMLLHEDAFIFNPEHYPVSGPDVRRA
jgi:hypothetical protein